MNTPKKRKTFNTGDVSEEISVLIFSQKHSAVKLAAEENWQRYFFLEPDNQKKRKDNKIIWQLFSFPFAGGLTRISCAIPVYNNNIIKDKKRIAFIIFF